MNKFLARKNIPVVSLSTSSHDLSHCDYFQFPQNQIHLCGYHLEILENIQQTKRQCPLKTSGIVPKHLNDVFMCGF